MMQNAVKMSFFSSNEFSGDVLVDKNVACLRLLHMMNVRFSLLNMVHRILGVTLPNF
jgi:hypothetical protein